MGGQREVVEGEDLRMCEEEDPEREDPRVGGEEEEEEAKGWEPREVEVESH